MIDSSQQKKRGGRGGRGARGRGQLTAGRGQLQGNATGVNMSPAFRK